MDIQVIFLILQATFGIAAMVLGKLVYSDRTIGSFLFGLAMAFFSGGGLQLGLIFYQRTRKLTDKDRVKKVGVIERKAEQRALARAKAGYMTLKAGAYLMAMAIITMFFSGLGQPVLDILLKIFMVGLGIFCFFYLAYISKKEEQ